MLLRSYSDFLNGLAKSNKNLVRLGTTARHYFYMAEAEVEAFEQSCREYLNTDRDGEENASRDRAIAHCLSFYMHARTCVNAARQLNSALPGDSTVENCRKKWEVWITEEVVNKANDMMIHPLDKDGKPRFYEPGGLEVTQSNDVITGKIDIYEWDLAGSGSLKVIQVNPKPTLQKLFEYLEEIGTVCCHAAT